MGIESWGDFKRLSAGEIDGVERPADVPAHPTYHYESIHSFEEFIEAGRKYLKKSGGTLDEPRVFSLEELKEVVKDYGIDSHRKWMKAVREGILPGRYPSRPESYYSDWSGWKDFLAPKKRFLPFEEARAEARKLSMIYGLEAAKDWRHFSRARKRPKNLPSNPSEYYDEWISWEDWFGVNRDVKN